MDLQIDDFYKDCAAGMLMLYQAFPRKVALYIEDLIGHEEPDEFGLPSKRHQGCLGALIWLAGALAGRGGAIAAGEIVLSGSVIKPYPVARGDRFVFDFGPPGTIDLSFE